MSPRNPPRAAGAEFLFDLGDDVLLVWGSWTNAREEVYLNDTLLSRKRSFRMSSTHDITIDGVPYQVTLRLERACTRLSCTVARGGVEIARQELGPGLRGLLIGLGVSLVAGLAVGYGSAVLTSGGM